MQASVTNFVTELAIAVAIAAASKNSYITKQKTDINYTK